MTRRLALLLIGLLVGPGTAAAQAISPTLPQATVDTSVPITCATDHVVRTGGSVQAALDVAQLGDCVTLEAGAIFTATGVPFILRNRTSGSGWIVIRSSALASLPVTGTRVGPGDAANMPTLVADHYLPAVVTEPTAHHYRFVGIEVTGNSLRPGTSNGGLIQLDAAGVNYFGGRVTQTMLRQVPHDIIFDRVYVHAPGLAAEYIRGLIWNSGQTAIVDSYVSGFKSTTNDTQAIIGWNGPGPFGIVNTYLEAAGENVMFGGGPILIPHAIPSDITIQRNEFFKPVSWRPGDPSYAGTRWLTKNLIEFKQGQRVLIEGNIFTNHWAGGQAGFFFQMSPRTESGQNPWMVTSDITVRYNLVRHVTAGFALSGLDYPSVTGSTGVFSSRISIHDNLLDDVGAFASNDGNIGWLLFAANGLQNLSFEHNTVFNTGTTLYLSQASVGPLTNLTWRNNIFVGAGYGIVGEGTGNGVLALDGYAPGPTWVYLKNAVVGPWPNRNGVKPPPSSPLQFPDTGTNFFPASQSAVGYTNVAAGPTDYHGYVLTNASPFRLAGTDGKDLGVDYTALDTALGGGAPPPPGRGPARRPTPAATLPVPPSRSRHPRARAWPSRRGAAGSLPDREALADHAHDAGELAYLHRAARSAALERDPVRSPQGARSDLATSGKAAGSLSDDGRAASPVLADGVPGQRHCPFRFPEL
jgi:hypothetical protein